MQRRHFALLALQLLLGPPRPLQAAAPALRLVDQAGARLQLARPAERIATPGISLAALILALGGEQRLGAVAAEVRNNPWLRHIFPRLAHLPIAFRRPLGLDAEQLLLHRPDLVTLWLGSDLLAQRLRSLALPVLTLGYTTPEGLMTAARLLGQALGVAARAERFIHYYRNNLQRVATALAGLAPSERPRIYYASITPLHTEGADSMVDAWIRAAGGVNLAAQHGLHGDGSIALERLLAWDPEIIITLGERQRQAILTDPRWRPISAVRTRRVITNPKGINAWCTRAAEAALQVVWAAKTFHPQRLPEIELPEETRTFYRQFYGYALSDAEVVRVLSGLPPG